MADLNPNIITVDEHDNIIGEGEVLSVHRGEGIRHRAISVFLFNHEGKLLIQQRSKEKIVGALQWANTCCGNVHVGETREQCAYRRLKGELGIEHVTLRSLYTFEYHVQCNTEFSEWEVDEVFVGNYDGEVTPNHKEVAQIQWCSESALKSAVKEDPKKYAPWLQIILEDQRYKQKHI